MSKLELYSLMIVHLRAPTEIVIQNIIFAYVYI